MPPPEARGAANNLDLLRLAAALLVLLSHAYVLAGRPDEEPVAILLHHVADGGSLAVAAFFVISGYLVARSAEAHPWRTYLRARALRIYPAFATLVLLQVLALGPLLSTLGPTAYFRSPETWAALARSLVFSPPPGLPGLFDANPLPGVVNGSLWTLRIEVLCYAATLAWAALGAPRVLALFAVGTGVAALAAAHATGAPLRTTAVLDCLLFYASGTALWAWRGTVPLRWPACLALLAGFAAAAATRAAPYAWHAALPYAVLCLGFSRPVLPAALARLGDVSYGTYLYAFPIAQCLAPYCAPHPLLLAAAALPPTLLAAFASSRLVERPALGWKRTSR